MLDIGSKWYLLDQNVKMVVLYLENLTQTVHILISSNGTC
jgi:hypothetical protein